MKIASFNVNGINGRLSIHLRWLEVSGPDVTLLREGCGTHIGRGARSSHTDANGLSKMAHTTAISISVALRGVDA